MSKALLGKVIAEQIEGELKEKLSGLSRMPSVGIVYVGNNPVIESFVSRKERFAERIGVPLVVYRLSMDLDTETLVQEVRKYAGMHDGMIVQLPLPATVDADRVLDAVPLPKDVDMLSVSARAYIADGHAEILPAVASAIREFAERENITLVGKKVVVIGKGKLVGLPVQAWLRTLHIEPIMVDRETKDMASIIENADVIVSGAGVPGLITADMVKEGVVLFDAGTSEVEGKIEGDVHKDAYLKASYYTPVPGGIGPLTIACIFTNLMRLMNL